MDVASSRSGTDRGRFISVDLAGRRDRQLGLLILSLGIPWLIYTRLYFWLHPRGLTVAPSIFMAP